MTDFTEPTAYERSWLEVVRALDENPAIEVSYEHQGDVQLEATDASGSFDDLEDWEGISLDRSLCELNIRFAELGRQWQTAGPHAWVAGEFHLTPLALLVHEDPPSFESSLHSEAERRVGAELRVIDEGPVTGAGHFAAIRLQPGVGNPEVWYSDSHSRLWKMDLDYPGYLEALRITKGAYDWQHLFTEAPLGTEEYDRTPDRLADMLEALPEIFPDHDYEPLRARLAERLR
ncbi:hypothetical protein ABT337_23195 [Saccharopolyspora hirsuta]|uniref:Uncharacterized protein n=1 Tax=Saccharopolyspora hirsuta TaxID=1837 RepID=A0A5M7C6M1_SACHI|nr:hypothetical protein [Saccharopolyspora hirsuta]KAA5836077.1 hypothetical protein F1721_06995 [Saccharopolyspora hirsuta]